jgi:hypothetical protein
MRSPGQMEALRASPRASRPESMQREGVDGRARARELLSAISAKAVTRQTTSGAKVRSMQDPRRYKVVRLLDDLLPRAATPQKSRISLDIRLYLREDTNDGHLWAEVAFIDRDTGKLINAPDTALPLDRPEAIGWFFDLIAERGFRMAVEMRTQPRQQSR